MNTPEGDAPVRIPQAAVDVLAGAEWIIVFTGAGMSAESGVPTFRDAQTGLWENFDPEQLASPEAWNADPALVWGWYQWRAHLVSEAEPNAGHVALTALAESADGTGDMPSVMVVTQNVDDLHERAGNTVVSHLHGSLFAPRCSRCGHPYQGTDADPSTATDERPVEPPACPICLSPVRPGVVWFGESLPADAWARAEQVFDAADAIIVVGTSGIVYPAAALPERAAARGIPVIELNPQPSGLSSIATHSIRTTAARGLPDIVERVRAARAGKAD
ncbi:NAD-dependent deacylase [Gordonia otitidis]|uniref:NAD-dependent protein deacylase n=1 Tax=Gordonia otitidis (strain DSM 44809 / CCUG 52243 / JCM 12355 / NBRC 100426 / IFM 10032) TaxID=1108044 RepID=H5TGI2_GORO1|nr:NAD-dependent deacylase [Gordonia otitidis]GAB32590.1 NAD-dependent deacetylase [Gordonia otitidis NBRC 100426]